MKKVAPLLTTPAARVRLKVKIIVNIWKKGKNYPEFSDKNGNQLGLINFTCFKYSFNLPSAICTSFEETYHIPSQKLIADLFHPG